MDKRIVLAVAGSGKTYYIANDFKEGERVILISFTNSNVDNIRKEVRKRFNGIIPGNVQIMTFDKFIYNILLRPLEPLSSFPKNRSKGVDVFLKPEDDTRKPNYVKKGNIGHFVSPENKYFVSRMSKLFLEQNQGYKTKVLSRLQKYCDAIYFDEFQDYKKEDFKVVKYVLEKAKLKVSAVGDIYQSCLTPIRNTTHDPYAPFNKINNAADLKEKFIKKVNIDETSLEKSRRVPRAVCDMINTRIGINIQPFSETESEIIHLSRIEEIHEVMIDSSIPKLIWDRRSINKLGQNYVNWSYSKGDTYSQACVILTDKTSNSEEWSKLSSVKTRNALYVALTRSEGDLYLVTNSDYKKWSRYVDNIVQLSN